MNQKQKIISVLTYPYENCFVVQITRATNQFDYPQVCRRYKVNLDASYRDSMTYWLCKIQSLHQAEMIKRLVDNYNKKEEHVNKN